MNDTITIEQHRDFGNGVKKFRELLLHQIAVGTRQRRKTAIAAVKHMDKMKSCLDDIACSDYWEVIDITKVYYGGEFIGTATGEKIV